MKAIQCPKCGKMNDGSTDFCIYCGTIYDEYRAEDDDFNIFTIGKGLSKKTILDNINNLNLNGSTALYPASIAALKILENENEDKYVSSVILMTDGLANVGTFSSLIQYYNKINKEIPIYSITFGDADEDELGQIADLTNGKVFDGKTSLIEAFKKVRGYN